MQQGTINDITNLKFYRDNGLEIPMQKVYSMSWTVTPGEFASHYIQDELSGYFIGDIDVEDPENIKISEETLMTGVVGRGNIMARFSNGGGTDKYGMQIFDYNEPVETYEYYNYLKKVVLDPANKVTISLNTTEKSYTAEYRITDIFTMTGLMSTYPDYYTINTVYTGNNLADDYEYYQVIQLEKFDFVYYQDTAKPFVLTLYESALPTIALYFPFVNYQGSYHQEKISEGFIASDTLMVLEENFDIFGQPSYARPYISANSEYYIVFKPTDNSGELKMVKKDITYDIEYTDDISFDLAYEEEPSSVANPLYFTVAFQAETEGAYQNYLGMYMRSKNYPDKDFYMGIVSIKTEVEGEDERFRTLLTNFGVPDPVYYPNIFAEQDYQEQGKDYMLINKKSKQMMLTYDQIFSYIGTYKALMNAIKFLGYYDIIFKEWYTLRTSNDTNIDVAVQVFDTSNGEFLKQKLASYGVSIEDFRNYNKINKLSMIYHLNQQDDETEKVSQKLVFFNEQTKKYEFISDQTYVTDTCVPMTKPVSIYRTDEILTKLIAVKKWLERHVIGVGAYIADITGEALYFGWQKTQGYQTQHHLTDFSQEQYYTADVKSVKPFKNSSTDIVCTLTELNGAVSFDDYAQYIFDDFIRAERDISIKSTTGVFADLSTLILSNTIETPVLGDEFEFDLQLNTSVGTLCEWTKPGKSQILYDSGMVKLMFEGYKDATIDSGSLPYITLENANIHNAYGEWRTNIQWMIREVIDSETGNTAYKLKNYKTALLDSSAIYSRSYFIMYADPSNANAYLKYTEDTKWGQPMFMMHGYNFINVNIPDGQITNFDTSSGHYILEILKGDMLFKDVSNHSVKVMFDNDYLKNSTVQSGIYEKQQRINLEYLYHSDRVPFTSIDDKRIITDTSGAYDLSETVQTQMAECKVQMAAQYMQMANNILKRLNVSDGQSAAYQELIDFIDGDLTDDYGQHLDVMSVQTQKALLYAQYLVAYKNNYICNQDVSVNVNRLGKYNLIARAYDKYNNMFVSKYDNLITVDAPAILVDIFTHNPNSDNKESFYPYNTEGKQMSGTDIYKLLMKCNSKPKFPSNYKIINFNNDPKNHTVKFDNMSYCIDVPKNNDYVIFENCTEKCDHAVQESGMYSDSLKIYMLDENPNKIHLYSQMTTNVNVVVYDKILMDDICIYNCSVSDRYYQSGRTDTDINANSYLILQFPAGTNMTSVIDLVNNEENNTYILNTTEYDVKKFTYAEDFDKRQTLFTDLLSGADQHGYPLFNVEDAIKARYYKKYTADSSSMTTIAETAYRILNIYIYMNDGTVLDMKRTRFSKINKQNISRYGYLVDGLLNKALITDTDTECFLTYANEYPVHYTTNINDDGIEYNRNIGYDGYHILEDEFSYDFKHMTIGSYIDDTYSGRILDYDRKNLIEIWQNSIFELGNTDNVDLYYYHNFPVTIGKDKLIMFTHNDVNNVFMSGYHVEWLDKATVLTDAENMYNYINSRKKETLYRSVNDVVSIMPEYYGPHDIHLICIDKFGNKLSSQLTGLYYIN